MGFLIIQPRYQAYAVKLKIREHPTTGQLIQLLQTNPPGNLADATNWFSLLASRVNGMTLILSFFQWIIKLFLQTLDLLTLNVYHYYLLSRSLFEQRVPQQSGFPPHNVTCLLIPKNLFILGFSLSWILGQLRTLFSLLVGQGTNRVWRKLRRYYWMILAISTNSLVDQ